LKRIRAVHGTIDIPGFINTDLAGHLSYIQKGHGELISRNGNVFRGFAELATWIAAHLRVEGAVLDGDCQFERW
jgi:hypothetical protein